MSYGLMAAISAVIGILPLLASRKIGSAVGTGIFSFLILWWLYYVATPSTIWPLYGLVGVGTILVLVVSAFVDGVIEDEITWSALAPVVGVLLFFGSGMIGCSALNAANYANMIGPIEERSWTTDVQPKDPEHMRMVSAENALYLAQKAVGAAGNIGSQFQLDLPYMTLQRVKDRLVYAVPFDYSGFFQWYNTDGSPAFIVIDAQDPQAQPHVATLPAGARMQYMPNAWFTTNLERHLRNNGFLNDSIAEFHFELDDEEHPWWVAILSKPTIWWRGERVTGIAVVNPVTGDIVRYGLDEIPEWVDRVIPESIVTNYLTWKGLYAGGWFNSWTSQAGLTEPEDPLLIYGAENRAEWVIGISSTNEKDDSLISIVYIDSRTGKPVSYQVPGGATETAIVNAVNENQQVKYLNLHASSPQIYNVYGVMAAVVPVLNSINAFQGVAIVPINSVQDVAFGNTQSETLRSFQALVFRRGQQVALERTPDLAEITGTIDRIRQDVGTNGGVYFVHLVEVPRIFTVSSGEHPTIVLTQPGDAIAIRYIASGESFVPIQSFENRTFVLESTPAQERVEAATQERAAEERQTDRRQDIQRRLENLTPEELDRIDQQLKERP